VGRPNPFWELAHPLENFLFNRSFSSSKEEPFLFRCLWWSRFPWTMLSPARMGGDLSGVLRALPLPLPISLLGLINSSLFNSFSFLSMQLHCFSSGTPSARFLPVLCNRCNFSPFFTSENSCSKFFPEGTFWPSIPNHPLELLPLFRNHFPLNHSYIYSFPILSPAGRPFRLFPREQKFLSPPCSVRSSLYVR